jgi:hypothetical protein
LRIIFSLKSYLTNFRNTKIIKIDGVNRARDNLIDVLQFNLKEYLSISKFQQNIWRILKFQKIYLAFNSNKNQFSPKSILVLNISSMQCKWNRFCIQQLVHLSIYVFVSYGTIFFFCDVSCLTLPLFGHHYNNKHIIYLIIIYSKIIVTKKNKIYSKIILFTIQIT